jgi:hypothetical protein
MSVKLATDRQRDRVVKFGARTRGRRALSPISNCLVIKRAQIEYTRVGMGARMSSWTREEIERIAVDVGAIREIQQCCLANCYETVKFPDRVAHQYQIAGGKVSLKVGSELPQNLNGVGLFRLDSDYTGIGRISTGLGCPHAETAPDFLGLSLAFLTPYGNRVDFVAINNPAAPTDTHVEFMKLLAGAAEGAGSATVVSDVTLGASLVRSLGLTLGARIMGHVTKQTLRTALSSTAYQSYWTGIVEASGSLGKCVLAPIRDENQLRGFPADSHHLTEEWHGRQARGPVEFDLYWLSFIDEQATPLLELTKAWIEHRCLIGRVTFPRSDRRSAEAVSWAALAAEMGANPGNWVRDRTNSIPEPQTEFGLARKIAYKMSQEGRSVLPESDYADVFSTGVIGEELAAELRKRRDTKRRARHIDGGP